MINFAEVEKSVSQLTQQFAAGELNEKALEEKLLQLIDVAADGNYWMLGHRTGRWFRYDGQKWMPDNPPVAPLEANYGMLDWQEVFINLLVLLAIGGVVYFGSSG